MLMEYVFDDAVIAGEHSAVVVSELREQIRRLLSFAARQSEFFKNRRIVKRRKFLTINLNLHSTLTFVLNQPVVKKDIKRSAVCL